MTDAPRKICPVCFSAFCEPDQSRCPGCDAARNGHPATTTTKTNRRGPYLGVGG
jgi:hypothetical protein